MSKSHCLNGLMVACNGAIVERKYVYIYGLRWVWPVFPQRQSSLRHRKPVDDDKQTKYSLSNGKTIIILNQCPF